MNVIGFVVVVVVVKDKDVEIKIIYLVMVNGFIIVEILEINDVKLDYGNNLMEESEL